jgi:hypothetical protein
MTVFDIARERSDLRFLHSAGAAPGPRPCSGNLLITIMRRIEARLARREAGD